MSEIDPDTLLEWLQTGHSDVTLLALEQLCTILLLSDNIDRCFESYPPRSFLPALCKIFLDEMATDSVLEATARAITYYLDVSQECTRRIVAVEGTLRAICNRLLVIEVDNKTSKDLAEQCIKSLELICARESAAVFEAGGLNCILPFILEHGKLIYKDTLHSAMSVVTRLCGKMEPNDPSLDFCVETLSELLKHEDNFVADGALRCFASLSDRFTRKGVDPSPLARHGLIEELIRKLGDSVMIYNSTNKWSSTTSANNASTAAAAAAAVATTTSTSLNQSMNNNNNNTQTDSQSTNTNTTRSTVVSISTLTGLLSSLCRNSDTITKEILESNILDSIEKAMYGDERCVLDTMRFLDLLITLIFEGRDALPKAAYTRTGFTGLKNAVTNSIAANTGLTKPTDTSIGVNQTTGDNTTTSTTTSTTIGKSSTTTLKSKQRIDPATEKFYRQLIEWIRVKDTESLIETFETNQVDINFMDDVGQTLLNWASAFGTAEMVEYLAAKGADVNKGLRSSSLHYAACFGRANIVKILLRHGANPELRDEEGKTALDKARERGEENHREVVQILQSPSDYINNFIVNCNLADGLANSNVTSGDEFNTDEETTENSSTDAVTITNVIAAAAAVSASSSLQTNQIDPTQTTDAQNGQILTEPTSDGSKSQSQTVLTDESQEPPSMTPSKTRSDLIQIKNLNEIKLNYTKRLIPILCKVFLNCMIQSINKSCLNLLRKLINCASKSQLNEIVQLSVDPTSQSHSTTTTTNAEQETQTVCLSTNSEGITISSLLVELISKVLQEEQNYESIYIGLSISNDLFRKCSPFILEEFTRLGVGHLISQLAMDAPIENEEIEETSQDAATSGATSDTAAAGATVGVSVASGVNQQDDDQHNDDDDDDDDVNDDDNDHNDDATEIVSDNAYIWNKEWCIIYSKDFIYLWNKYCAIELSHNSNGWFRFLINNKLYSMYSNGQPEVGSDNDENKPIFANKFSKAKQIVNAKIETLESAKTNTNTTNTAAVGAVATKKISYWNLFSKKTSQTKEATPLEIKVENWLFSSPIENELQISNIHTSQKTILRRGVNGFEFESNKNEILKFVGKTELGIEFSIPWLLNTKDDNRKSLLGTPAAPATASGVANTTILNNGEKTTSKPSIMTPSLANTTTTTTTTTTAATQASSANQITIGNTNIKIGKLDTSLIASTSARLSALQQYLAAASIKTAKLKQKQLRLSVNKLALRLHQDYLQKAQDKPRDLAVRLINLVGQMRDACFKHETLPYNDDDVDHHHGNDEYDSINKQEQQILDQYEQSLIELKKVLSETNKSISSYELSMSGLVQTLIFALCPQLANDTNYSIDANLIQLDSNGLKKVYKRNKIFSNVFNLESKTKEDPTNNNNNSNNLIIILLHKLISLFESIEKYPLYLYDAPGSYNLQAFSKRFKLILNKGENEINFLDFSGRTLKVEPLANVSHLEKYIAKMVTKQWFDYERSSLYFIKYLNDKSQVTSHEFKYETDFDENGLLYWIGTNGKTKHEWANPSAHNLVKLSVSDGKALASGQVDDLVGRVPANCHTGDDKRCWIVIDLGVFIIPTHYTLRYSRGFSKSAPRNWTFLMSKTGGPNSADWDIIYAHINDDRLKEFGCSATWSLTESNMIKKELSNKSNGWRFARIQQNGKNQSGSNYSLSLCGFEIYGTVYSAVVDQLMTVTLNSSSTRIQIAGSESEKRKHRRLMQSANKQSHLQKQMILGARVIKGVDWKWTNQDKLLTNSQKSNEETLSSSSLSCEGTLIGEPNDGWVEIIWDNGIVNFYRMGYESKYDLQLAPSHDPEKLNTYYAIALQNLAMSKSTLMTTTNMNNNHIISNKLSIKNDLNDVTTNDLQIKSSSSSKESKSNEKSQKSNQQDEIAFSRDLFNLKLSELSDYNPTLASFTTTGTTTTTTTTTTPGNLVEMPNFLEDSVQDLENLTSKSNENVVNEESSSISSSSQVVVEVAQQNEYLNLELNNPNVQKIDGIQLVPPSPTSAVAATTVSTSSSSSSSGGAKLNVLKSRKSSSTPVLTDSISKQLTATTTTIANNKNLLSFNTTQKLADQLNLSDQTNLMISNASTTTMSSTGCTETGDVDISNPNDSSNASNSICASSCIEVNSAGVESLSGDGEMMRFNFKDETGAGTSSASAAASGVSPSNTQSLDLNLVDDKSSSNSSFRAYFSSTSHNLLEQKKILRHYSLQNTHDKSQSANNLVSFVDNMQLTVSEPNALNQLYELKNTNESSVNASGGGGGVGSVGSGGGGVGGATNKNINQTSLVNSSLNGPPTSSSSSYFPLEPTMEECLESLDISYDASESANSQAVLVTFEPNDTLKSLNSKADNSTYLSENEDDNNNNNNNNSNSGNIKDSNKTSTSSQDYLSDETDLFSNLFSKDPNEIDLLVNTLNALTRKKSKLIELLKTFSSIKNETANLNEFSIDNLKMLSTTTNERAPAPRVSSTKEETTKMIDQTKPNLSLNLLSQLNSVTTSSVDSNDESSQLEQEQQQQQINFVESNNNEDQETPLGQFNQQVWTNLLSQLSEDANNNTNTNGKDDKMNNKSDNSSQLGIEKFQDAEEYFDVNFGKNEITESNENIKRIDSQQYQHQQQQQQHDYLEPSVVLDENNEKPDDDPYANIKHVDDNSDQSISNVVNNLTGQDDSSALTLSVILQRCQSSIDGALAQQIDAAMLQEIDDDEELMRDTAIADENETDENNDDEFMEEDEFVTSEKALGNTNTNREVTSNSRAFENSLQRMRELKRRHASHHYNRYNNNNSANTTSTSTSNNTNQTSTTTSSGHKSNEPTDAGHLMHPPEVDNGHLMTHHHDEFVLKCQFSALIPAFDPRPGKTNINQIQDISVPTMAPTTTTTTSILNAIQSENVASINQPADSSSAESKLNRPIPKVELYLKVESNTTNSNSLQENSLEFISDEIKLTNKNATIFQYIQNLISLNKKDEKNSFLNNTLHFERMKNIWDMNYILTYRESIDTQTKCDSSGASASTGKLLKQDNTNDNTTNMSCNVNQVLQLLSILQQIIYDTHLSNKSLNDTSRVNKSEVYFNMPYYKKEFISEKINNKLIQQLQDPLVLASRSLPEWCKTLLQSYKFLFPYDTRQLYFSTTAFGVSRSIVWLQNKRDALLSNLRGPTSQRALRDDHEFRIGRLKHERIKIPRDPAATFLKSAMNALKFHATRKAILEVEFIDEEGTGLGPTLEFFSLIASELQRKKFALWYCDDKLNENELDDSQKANLDDVYVHQTNGLFPAPYPSIESMSQDDKDYADKYQNLIEFFNFMGIFVAKSLQDQRLVDLPFSFPFLKILCSYRENHLINEFKSANNNNNNDSSATNDSSISGGGVNNNNTFDLDGLINLNDLALIDPHRAQLLLKLKSIVDERKANGANKLNKSDDFMVEINGHLVNLEDLGLVFEYNPPSKVFEYKSYSLKPNGENIHVNQENVEEYIELMSKFILKDGIETQLQAFKDGFDSVFSIESLKCFEPNELQLLISGDQAPNWTYDEIVNYTEPKLGYTKDSVGFQRFVNVMCQMNPEERKKFVQFLTGCSSLPPGGLANLHPRLTVVRKDGSDSSYPSVNTCVHYLKLPEYSSEEILKKQLSIACKEKGFYLN